MSPHTIEFWPWDIKHQLEAPSDDRVLGCYALTAGTSNNSKVVVQRRLPRLSVSSSKLLLRNDKIRTVMLLAKSYIEVF